MDQFWTWRNDASWQHRHLGLGEADVSPVFGATGLESMACIICCASVCISLLWPTALRAWLPQLVSFMTAGVIAGEAPGVYLFLCAAIATILVVKAVRFEIGRSATLKRGGHHRLIHDMLRCCPSWLHTCSPVWKSQLVRLSMHLSTLAGTISNIVGELTTKQMPPKMLAAVNRNYSWISATFGACLFPVGCWVPFVLGSSAVRFFLTATLVFTSMHAVRLVRCLRTAARDELKNVQSLLAVWWLLRSSPRRLAMPASTACIVGWLSTYLDGESILTILLLMTLVLAWMEDSRQRAAMCILEAMEPVLACLPTAGAVEQILTSQLMPLIAPVEDFCAQLSNDSRGYKFGVASGLCLGMMLALAGFLGQQIECLVLHVTSCVLLARFQANEHKVCLFIGRPSLQGFVAGLALFLVVEFCCTGYIFGFGPLRMHLDAEVALGPWTGGYCGVILGSWLTPLIGGWLAKRLEPRFRDWLGIFYQPFLNDGLSEKVSATLGGWLGVGLGAWLGWGLGAWFGVFLGAWIAPLAGLVCLMLFWLLLFIVTLQIQMYVVHPSSFGLRHFLFKLWAAAERGKGIRRDLNVPAPDGTCASAIGLLAATLGAWSEDDVPPGCLVVNLQGDGLRARAWARALQEGAGQDGLRQQWASAVARALQDGEPIPMLCEWEDGSGVYGLNYEWLHFYRDQKAQKGYAQAQAGKPADEPRLDESSQRAFRKLGHIFGCCLLEEVQLVRASTAMYRSALSGSRGSADGQISAHSQSDLAELCPSTRECTTDTGVGFDEDGAILTLPARHTSEISFDFTMHSQADGFDGIDQNDLSADILENHHVVPLLTCFGIGFRDGVGNTDIAKLLAAEEVQLMLGGAASIDVEDWACCSRYAPGVPGGFSNGTIQLFWQALRCLDQTDLQEFCHFATGFDVPPLGGFKYLSPPFSIGLRQDAGNSIEAHAGLSAIELPRSSLETVEQMRTAILSAAHASLACQGGCGLLRTTHPTHCCPACERRLYFHSPSCKKATVAKPYCKKTPVRTARSLPADNRKGPAPTAQSVSVDVSKREEQASEPERVRSAAAPQKMTWRSLMEKQTQATSQGEEAHQHTDPARMGERLTCGQCGKDGTKVCAGCGQVAYCSHACQKAQWPLHRSACKAAREAEQGTCREERSKDVNEPQFWEVVGGVGRGGIVVREGCSLVSPELARLSTGAIVREIEVNGNRLHYKRWTGMGPDAGWVSLEINGKSLLSKTERPPFF